MIQHQRYLRSVVVACLSTLTSHLAAATLEPLPALDWEREYLRPDLGEGAVDLAVTPDGGYLALTYTADLGTPIQNYDVHLVWLSPSGEVVRERTYGGPYHDYGYRCLTAPAGGYLVVAGSAEWDGGPFIRTHLWRLAEDGAIIWERTYGEWRLGVEAVPRADGGFIVAGYVVDPAGDDVDVWLMEVDAAGELLAEHVFPGDNRELPASLQPTPDGGYILCGSASTPPSFQNNVYLLKLDSDLAAVWSHEYDLGLHEFGRTAYPSRDGGYVVIGDSHYTIAPHGQKMVVLRTDATGELLDTYDFRPERWTVVGRTAPTLDGGIAATGSTSDGGDISRYFLLKLEGNGATVGQQFYEHSGDSFRPSAVVQDQQSAYVMLGVTGPGPSYQQDDLMLAKTLPELPTFVRGNSNGDPEVDISDPIHTLGFLFTGGTTMACRDAADSNDDGDLDLSDAVYTLNFLFGNGRPPPPPYPGAGIDPTSDGLSCDGSGS